MLNLSQNPQKKKRIHFALLPYIFYYCVKIMWEEDTVRMAWTSLPFQMNNYIQYVMRATSIKLEHLSPMLNFYFQTLEYFLKPSDTRLFFFANAIRKIPNLIN